MKLNPDFSLLGQNYLFGEIEKRVEAFKRENPKREILRLGVGDVTKPLPEVVVEAMTSASKELLKAVSFRGYPPTQGYLFLREKIKEYYASFSVNVDVDEIFISDGAKTDLGLLTELTAPSCTVTVLSPVYPVYADTNLLAGKKLLYRVGTIENGFLPDPDETKETDVIYLCSPNNPTGATYDKLGLKKWVDYALKNQALLVFDSAYERFMTEEKPRSIFEIDGARDCAIEIASFSKTAGFTGVRCGYTVFPKSVASGKAYPLWQRLYQTKRNGVSYITQRGAEAVFSKSGLNETGKNISAYRENARRLSALFIKKGWTFFGGTNSPYLWLRCPSGENGWAFFDFLLKETGIVGTPGEGFGRGGEGYFRLSAFASEETTLKAVALLEKI